MHKHSAGVSDGRISPGPDPRGLSAAGHYSIVQNRRPWLQPRMGAEGGHRQSQPCRGDKVIDGGSPRGETLAQPEAKVGSVASRYRKVGRIACSRKIAHKSTRASSAERPSGGILIS